MSGIVIWCVAFAIYLLFAGTVSRNELITATVLAVLCAVWSYAAREISRERFSASRRQIMPILRAVANVLPATVRTGVILLKAIVSRPTPGRAVQNSFQSGAENDPDDRSRRAIALLCASLAPDRFVVSAERGVKALLHTVEPQRAELDPEWLQ